MVKARSSSQKGSIKPSRSFNIDEYRQWSESDKSWAARRQFIEKNISEYEDKDVDKLVALSMVWVNHVFMGCWYDDLLLTKVLEMAEGISVGEMPSFELVRGAQAKKKRHSSEESEQHKKKLVSRPRFQPMNFVSVGNDSSEEGTDKEENESEMNDDRQEEPDHQTYDGSRDSGPSSSCAASETVKCGYDGQADSQADQIDENEGSGAWQDEHSGLGFGQRDTESSSEAITEVHNQPDSGGSGLLPTPLLPTPILTETTVGKQSLILSVSSAIGAFISDIKFTGQSESPMYNLILTRSIQACKTNPEYIHVNLKDIPPSDLPKNIKMPSEGYACELRCRGIYLATGYSGSKNGARDRASEQAVKLLMKPVEVRVIQRQYKCKTVNDVVVCQVNAPNPILLPPLRNPEDEVPPSTKGQYELNESKHWTQFVLMENAHDAISLLNNSAAYNRMKVAYTLNPGPNSNSWLCSVYLQDELLAQASGTKKSSKHLAAEEAVRILRMLKAPPQQQEQQNMSGGDKSSEKPFGELVVFESSNNPISIIYETAQFNNVAVNFNYTVLADYNWKCEIYLDGKFMSGAIGPKKIVKHIVAAEVVAILRRTQAVVKSKANVEVKADAVSLKRLKSQVSNEYKEHEIKEDNIGNQLLRKMGWTGGGLGKEGKGIATPIKVTKQLTRQGLGSNARVLHWEDIKMMFKKYVKSGNQDDLHFTSDLSREERQEIHITAKKFGLCTKSYGRGTNRFLVVRPKKKKNKLMGHLMQKGKVGRYELIKPSE